MSNELLLAQRIACDDCVKKNIGPMWSNDGVFHQFANGPEIVAISRYFNRYVNILISETVARMQD